MTEKVITVERELLEHLQDLVNFVQNIDQVSKAVKQFKVASDKYHEERLANEIAMSKAYLAKQETEETYNKSIATIQKAAADSAEVDAKLAKLAADKAELAASLKELKAKEKEVKAEKAAFDAELDEKRVAAEKYLADAAASSDEAAKLRETLEAKLKLLQS
jgi:transcriptional regulator with XRE-family HTH domain